jgi:glycosyltransferase involved in cell wall biosynthesis
MLSVLIPLNNKEPWILPFYDRLTAVLGRLQQPYEILFVDEASTDGSFDLMANLADIDGHLKVIRLRRDFGRAASLSAGFHESKGEIIIAMDGDLEHAPEDIPRLLAKIDEGYDIVTGGRKTDGRSGLRGTMAHLGDWLVAKIWNVERRDFGSTYRAYRASTLKEVNLYGELHRFLPELANIYGARAVEVPIQTPKHLAAGSHFGIGRTFHMLFDVLTIWFLLRYSTRPMHFFGKWGLVSAGLGGFTLAALAIPKLWTSGDIIGEHGPLVLLSALAVVTGVVLFCTGLLGEILMRTYFESQGRRIYAVREVRGQSKV